MKATYPSPDPMEILTATFEFLNAESRKLKASPATGAKWYHWRRELRGRLASLQRDIARFTNQ